MREQLPHNPPLSDWKESWRDSAKEVNKALINLSKSASMPEPNSFLEKFLNALLDDPNTRAIVIKLIIELLKK